MYSTKLRSVEEVTAALNPTITKSNYINSCNYCVVKVDVTQNL